MSRTFYLLLLLAPHGVLLTSQTRELQVSFIHPEFPVVKIKANCDPSSGRKMILDVYKCPMNASQPYLPVSLKGVCEEEGGTHCLTEDLRGEDCFAISGYFWKEKTLKYTSSELSLANVTFFSREFTVEATSWKQQGNTSVLHLKPVAGIPIYMLKLEDASQNKSGNCSSLVLTGGTEEPFDTIVFTAHWHQQVFPGCTYRVWFRPRTECQTDMIGAKDKELPRLQYVQASKEEILVEEPRTGKLFVASVATAGLLTSLAMVLLFAVIHHAWKSRRIQSSVPDRSEDTDSITPQSTAENLQLIYKPRKSPPVTVRKAAPRTVLLVYTPNLHRQMAALAARLKEMTELQIEDLHDMRDQDKLNDPTVWVTRRLMDPNTRFVLACSTVHHDNKEPSQELQGGATHFLLDDFLQHLRLSSLAYDYTRLHLVSFEDEPQVEVRDVTPGRVYQLPAHLPQLAQNLTLATPSTTTSPSNTSC